MDRPKPKFEVIKKDEGKLSMEMLTLGLFGVSMSELIEDIKTNKDGKYSSVYK